MTKHAKTALAAAFLLASASPLLAQASDDANADNYFRNPAAAVPIFQHQPFEPRGLVEGRNVGVRGVAGGMPAGSEAEKNWFNQMHKSGAKATPPASAN